METYHMFYDGEIRTLNDTVLDKFILIIDGSPLKEMFIKHASLTIMDSLKVLRETHLKGTEWKESWWYFYSDKHSRKKTRWKNKAFRDLKQKKMKTARELFRLYREYSEVYTEEEVEKKLSQPKKEVLQWAEEPNSYFFQYPFFTDKTPVTKSAALEDDLAIAFLQYLKNEWDEDKKRNGKEVTEFPYESQVVFANTISKKEMKYDGVTYQDGEEMPYKDVGLDDQPVRIMVKSTPLTNNMTKNFNVSPTNYDIDQIDRDLMTAVLEHRGENFAIDKTIEVRLGDLVGDIYRSKGKKNYDSILSRLIKLQRYRYTHVTPEEVNGVITGEVNNREHMGFIEYINEIKTDQGETYLSIEINQGLHKRFINNQTLKIYRDQIQLLDSSYRSMLLYMQKERIKAYRLGNTKIELSYTQFKANIRFRYSSNSKIREEITKSLDEIIKKGIIVKDYIDGPYAFEIEFEPIDRQEVRDIIGEKSDTISFDHLLPRPEEG